VSSDMAKRVAKLYTKKLNARTTSKVICSAVVRTISSRNGGGFEVRLLYLHVFTCSFFFLFFSNKYAVFSLFFSNK